MKTIGIVAITAEGAAECYKEIVKLAGQKLGVNHHPEIILINPSFDTILSAQKDRDWQAVSDIICKAAQKIIKAGADFIIMPANSVHFAYDLIAKELNAPVLNIIDIVVNACKKQGYVKVAVLGVGITMTDRLYDKQLADNDIKKVELKPEEIKSIDNIIYSELIHGKVNPESVNIILNICKRLENNGCEALILACTELQMVINSTNSPLSILDSTRLLANQATILALETPVD